MDRSNSESGSHPVWLDTDAYPFSRWAWPLSQGMLRGIDEGQGPPLVLVHGTPTWSFEYRHIVAGLRESRRCLAPDHFGFGLSDTPEGFSYSPEAHAAVFGSWMDTLALEKADFVLHDFGGPIALDWMLRHPERVGRVIIMNSFAWRLDDDPKRARVPRLVGGGLGRFLYRWANASVELLLPSFYGDKSKLTAAVHDHYRAPFRNREKRERVLHALARSLTQSSSYFGSLWERRGALADKPALVIWGLKDSAFPNSFLSRWKEYFPTACTVELAEAGHWPHEEASPEVLRAIRSFLAH